jgi:hypothetical protein
METKPNELEKKFKAKYPYFNLDIDFNKDQHKYSKTNGNQIKLSVSQILSNAKPAFKGSGASYGTATKLNKFYMTFENPEISGNNYRFIFEKPNLSFFLTSQAELAGILLNYPTFLSYLCSKQQPGTENENDYCELYAFMLNAKLCYKNENFDPEKHSYYIERRINYPSLTMLKNYLYEYTFYNVDKVPEQLYVSQQRFGDIFRIRSKEQLFTENNEYPMFMLGCGKEKKGLNYIDYELPDLNVIKTFVIAFWKESAIQGTLMHGYIEDWFNCVDYDAQRKVMREYLQLKETLIQTETVNVLKHMEDFMWLNDLKPFRTELIVYSPEIQGKSPEYAGQIDFVAENINGFSLFDWKRVKDILVQEIPSKQKWYHKCVVKILGDGNQNKDIKYYEIKNKDAVCEREGCEKPEDNYSFGSCKLEGYFTQLNLYRRGFYSTYLKSLTLDYPRVTDLNIVAVSPISHKVFDFRILCKNNAILTLKDYDLTWEEIEERTDALLYITYHKNKTNGRTKNNS